MADRREFQQERSRLLRDPEAGDDTQVEDAVGEGFGVAQEQFNDEDQRPVEPPEERSTAAGTEPLAAAFERPEVEVTATIVDDGIAVTFLIPHGLIGVALSE